MIPRAMHETEWPEGGLQHDSGCSHGQQDKAQDLDRVLQGII